MLDNDTKET